VNIASSIKGKSTKIRIERVSAHHARGLLSNIVSMITNQRVFQVEILKSVQYKILLKPTRFKVFFGHRLLTVERMFDNRILFQPSFRNFFQVIHILAF
jgi:hypothetical protein